MNLKGRITILIAATAVILFAVTDARIIKAQTSGAKGKATPQTPAKAPAKVPAKAPASSPAKANETTAAPQKTPPAPLAAKTIRPTDKKAFEDNLRLAVLVAPKYGGSGLTPLTYTLADATELGLELERQGYVVRVLKNNEAYADNVRQVLQQQVDLLKDTTDGTLLFGFTGHGFQLESTKKNYLVTTGVNVAPESIEKEALPVDEVEQMMNATKAKRKIILIDACRNDPHAKSAGVNRTMPDFHAAEGVAVLLSTSPGGTSYEDPELQHGIFTSFILDALRGKAAGPDGFVTFADLSGFVSKQVLAYAAKKGYSQKPFTTGEYSGDFLIATTAAPKPEEIQRPAGLAQVDNEAPVLTAVDIKRSFFVPVKDDVLNMYDSSSFQPYIAGLKKVPSPEGTLRFEGPGPQANTKMAVVMEMNGDQIKRALGRIGTACPNESLCGTPIPLAGDPPRPDEKVIKSCKITEGTMNVISKIPGLGKKQPNTNLSPACKAVKEALDALDSQKKFSWTSFNLTTEMPKPANARPAGR